MRTQLDSIAGDYATLLEGFLALLPVQKHVDLRFLLFRLDFTLYYSGKGGAASRLSPSGPGRAPGLDEPAAGARRLAFALESS